MEQAGAVDLGAVLPWHDGGVAVTRASREDAAAVAFLHDLLNVEIAAGTYPHEHALDREAFLAVFWPHEAFVARDESTGELLGGFYVKPNFPGRCGHVCNAGFLVAPAARGRGVGKVMAAAFEACAPRLGFRAVWFNLVFEDNVASIKIWEQRGYEVMCRIPDARRNDDGTYTAAFMFHKALPLLPPPSSSPSPLP